MNKKSILCIGVILISIGVFAKNENVRNQVKDFPCYRFLNMDKKLSAQFYDYMKWMSKLSPDGKLIFDFMDDKEQNIFTLSMIFHEKVEFCQWLQLGHKANNIMDIKYYQKNYKKVYPIAHRIAVIEEVNLIKYYAEKQGFENTPEISFLLTSPIIEVYNVPLRKIFSRVKYNLEYKAQVPFITQKDIETAISVYEKSGYLYKDKTKIAKDALAFVKSHKSSIMIFNKK